MTEDTPTQKLIDVLANMYADHTMKSILEQDPEDLAAHNSPLGLYQTLQKMRPHGWIWNACISVRSAALHGHIKNEQLVQVVPNLPHDQVFHGLSYTGPVYMFDKWCQDRMMTALDTVGYWWRLVENPHDTFMRLCDKPD